MAPDQNILNYITYNLEDNEMLNLLRPSIVNSVDEFGNVIRSKEEAIDYPTNRLKRSRRVSQNNE